MKTALNVWVRLGLKLITLIHREMYLPTTKVFIKIQPTG